MARRCVAAGAQTVYLAGALPVRHWRPWLGAYERLKRGAIDGDGGEKGGRFLQLCDAYGLPVISLVDTPGYMVGPDSEKTAAVRRGWPT